MDNSGAPLRLKGVNYPYCWYTNRDHAAQFEAMAAMGANAVNVMLCSGGRWTKTSEEQVSEILDLCAMNGLTPVLEVRDSTGYGDAPEAVDPEEAVNYWVEVRGILDGSDAIINIANAPFGNSKTGEWSSFFERAVDNLRSFRVTNVLMVDAPNWGQDTSRTMLQGAQAIADADFHGNTMFSVHMYEQFDTPDKVVSYVNEFENLGLPLVVGEFADSRGEGKNVAVSAIFDSYAGWLAWTWSGDSANSVVNDFNPASLTAWGEQVKAQLSG